MTSPSLGKAGGQSAQPTAGADAIEHVNEALSTIQRLASNIKKSETSQVQNRLNSRNNSSSRGGAVTNEDEDILDLTSDLILAESESGPVRSRRSAPTLVREGQDRARGSLAEPKGALAKLLAADERPDSSNSLPRSASKEVVSALNQASAALHGIGSDSDLSTGQKRFRGRSVGTIVVGKAVETTSDTTPSSARRAEFGAAFTSDSDVSLAERREINRRLDAVTNELAKLSTRMGALETLIERYIAQPPRHRLLRSRQESETDG